MKEAKQKASSAKTDAMRAQREAKHKELLEQRAAREKEAKRKPETDSLGASGRLASSAVRARLAEERDAGSVAQEQAEVDDEMPPTFKLWKQKVEALRDGEVDWTASAEAAEEAFDNGVTPGMFAATLEDVAEVE